METDDDVRTKKVTAHGREFEIRAAPEGDEWKVRLFEGARQVSPIVYTVSRETAIDARIADFPVDLIDELMEDMKRQVERGSLRLLPSN